MPIITYCGLDCSECPVFIATKTGDQALQEKTAREWSAQFAAYTGRNDLRAEELVCESCTAADSRTFLSCRGRPMRVCAREQKFVTCAECGRFESCEQLNGFFTQAANAKERLLGLRRKI
jgi:hypothetical protein